MNFEQCLNAILVHEGGYVNDPNDPGGETNFGISKRAHPQVDIRNLDRAGAARIYKSQYWNSINAEKFPAEIRLCYFDAAVNQGPLAAVKMLQKVLGTKQDGYPGTVTQAKARKFHRWRMVVNYQAERAVRYSKTQNFHVYGHGWMRRLMDITLQTGL